MKARFTAFLLCLIMLVLPAAAFAEGSASLSFSGDSEAVCGDSFVVELVFTASESFGTLQANFTYDNSKMDFISESNSVQASGGHGSIMENGSGRKWTVALEFRAITAGECELNVFNTEMISEASGKKLGNPSGSLEITILDSAEEVFPEDEMTELPEETPEEEPTENQEKIIVINGKKYISANADFSEGYQLLGDENGMLWLYCTGDGAISEYRPFSGNLLYRFAEQPELENYTAETVTLFDGSTVELYPTGAQGCYYVYLQNSAGDTAWYRYDAEDGSLQRAVVQQVTVELVLQEDDPTQRMIHVISMVLAAGCVVAAVILIIMIGRKKR